MIDYFAIALTHGLIALACLRLLFRADLDDPDAGPFAPRKRARRWRRDGADD